MSFLGPLQRRILKAALLHANRPAVSAPDGGSITHLQLITRAYRRAWRLAPQLDQVTGPVALRFPKDAALVENLLAVLLTGHNYVGLDRNSPDENWLHALQSLGANRLVHGANEGPTPATEIPVGFRSIKAGFGWPSFRWIQNLNTRSPADICAMVQTSGTSGMPCGVLQQGSAILHHAEWTISSQRIDHRSRLSWLASPAVAAAQSHLYAALLSGACLCPFEPSRAGLAAMTRWMRDERITHLHLTPSLLRAWLDSLPDGDSFPDLQSVKLGGEPARTSDGRLLRRKLGLVPRLLNGLGMSEASGNITLCEITADDLLGDGLLPVGHPVSGRLVTVESSPGVSVDGNETGEIVVRDQWVSPGYHPKGARNAITATQSSGINELRTGDVGRWDEQGRLVHLGRIDRRIRVRGITVDLADIEARAASLTTVKQVAALAEPSGRGRGFWIAIVPHNDTPEGRREIAVAVGKLSGVRPSRIGFFNDIPRKPTGKRDDARLLESWPDPAEDATWQGCETFVRAAWITVLGHSDFGPNDRFVDAGGDSLAAMNLALELSRLTQREVSGADLLRLPSVAQQALAMESLQLGSPDARTNHDHFHIDWVSINNPSSKRTALIHPGGYSSESDVWLAGSLLAYRTNDLSLLITRTNIENERIEAPDTLAEMVQPLLASVQPLQRPLLIGICVGSVVVAEIARYLASHGQAGVELILLDPWTPGVDQTTTISAVPHTERILRYYTLLKPENYGDLSSLTHIVLSGDDPFFETRKRYWSQHLRDPSRLHVVKGDHFSFIRAHRNETARALAKLIDA